MTIRRICHFSDSHLGYAEYGKISPLSGLNQREQDFYDAFDEVIARIIALKPDLAIHAGDLFHTPRPSNRAIRVALAALQRLGAAGIPLVLISGNHETPRIKATGSIFESIALFPGVYPAYQSRYERFTFADLDVHCLPHCSLTEELEAASAAIAIDPARAHHILVTHGSWRQGGSYSMGEFNEQLLPDFSHLFPDVFTYIALGHYHRRVDIAERISYCGASERTSISQANQACGFLEVDLLSGERIYHPVSSRAMVRLEPVSCRELTVADIYERVQSLAAACPDGAIVHLTLEQVPESTFLRLEMRVLEEIFARVFYLEKQLLLERAGEALSGSQAQIEALPLEFGRYVQNLQESELDGERLYRLGAHYLTAAEEES